MKQYRVGIIGATGYVGQRFVTLLHNHPWFKLEKLIASPRSAGRSYGKCMEGRWKIDEPLPEEYLDWTVESSEDMDKWARELDGVFCAVNLPKEEIIALETKAAQLGLAVISNNSAHRGAPDVPMIIPEINGDHASLILEQHKRLHTQTGFIACKPNCSIQSYVPALSPLRKFGIEQIMVVTSQAISGAGKTFKDWPEMQNNLIPYIGGEEAKSEQEPLKIWSTVEEGRLVKPDKPVISAQCYRVSVAEGHTAAVAVKFTTKPTEDEILEAWRSFESPVAKLPTAPDRFLVYHEENDRPQPLLDAKTDKGMAIHISRLREDPILDYKFACLSHNTLRGAAGGAVLMAELLAEKGYWHHR